MDACKVLKEYGKRSQNKEIPPAPAPAGETPRDSVISAHILSVTRVGSEGDMGTGRGSTGIEGEGSTAKLDEHQFLFKLHCCRGYLL